jgi:hypothetical protein
MGASIECREPFPRPTINHRFGSWKTNGYSPGKRKVYSKVSYARSIAEAIFKKIGLSA